MIRRLLIALACLAALPAWATTHYVSNSATNVDGCTDIGDPCRPNEVWNEVAAGDTVIYLDGVYTGANYMLVMSVNGTSGSHITVRPQTDGGVLLNGEFANQPVRVTGDYIDVGMFNACCSNAEVVRLGDNCTGTQIIGWDAGPGNSPIFLGRGDGNTYFQCAGFGIARKIFGTTENECNNNTNRYSLARWEGAHETGPKSAIDFYYDTAGSSCIGGYAESGVFIGGTSNQPDPYHLTYEAGDPGNDPNLACWCHPGSTCGCSASADDLDGCTNIQNWFVAGTAGQHQPGMDFNANGNLFILQESGNCHGSTDVGVLSVECQSTDNFSDVHFANNAVFVSASHTFVTPCCFGATSEGTPDASLTDMACVGPKASIINADWTQTDVQTATTLGGLTDSVWTGANARIGLLYIEGVEQTGRYLFPHPLQDRLRDLWTRTGNDGAHGSPWPGDPDHEHSFFQDCSGVTHVCSKNYVVATHDLFNAIGEVTAAFGAPPRGIAMRRTP